MKSFSFNTLIVLSAGVCVSGFQIAAPLRSSAPSASELSLYKGFEPVFGSPTKAPKATPFKQVVGTRATRTPFGQAVGGKGALPVREVAVKKVVAKKVGKKVIAKKIVAKKVVAKKVVAKKVVAKKVVAKKAPVKKVIAKKVVAKKTFGKKAAPAKAAPVKVVAKKTFGKKAAPAKEAPVAVKKVGATKSRFASKRPKTSAAVGTIAIAAPKK